MVNNDILLKAYSLMCDARAMAETYDSNRQICKFVHSTSRGHEAIQLAAAFQIKEYDYLSLYYRDESFLLGLGFTPYELMLQLLAKRDDPFSGGRTYYSHPSINKPGFPKIPHQSSATGMQAIPATGMAHAVSYLEYEGRLDKEKMPIVLCSLGDGSVTEGEVAEAFQMAVLKKLPIIYLVQDNNWGISASGDEMYAMNAYEYALGFKGMERIQIKGYDFIESYEKMSEVYNYVRTKRAPMLVHADVPLLGHHTSGVRKEWYRSEEDLKKHESIDPFPRLKEILLSKGASLESLNLIESDARKKIQKEFDKAVNSPDPEPEKVTEHEFAPTSVIEETGEREPEGREPIVMVDCALHAVDEILKNDANALLYGQDVGRRLGGVFREAATLAQKYGDHRVFNTPIEEAYIVGSTAGMSAVGLKPIVEIQFADYAFAGVNQLHVELSKSCYLSMGKFPVSSVIRIPIGAYGSGGPYHSGCIESSILPIRGIKVAYPSNGADLKGLMKSAYLDPNPVVMFEHKGLYWSKVLGTHYAMTIEPDENYVVPFGKARVVQHATKDKIDGGESLVIITYGMGVHWALNASKNFLGQIEILDLRTLNPVDEEAMYESVKKHNKCIVLTEEPVLNSFAESLAGRISNVCFKFLDAPVEVVGALNVPAIALNSGLERAVLPSAEKLSEAIKKVFEF
ncbi:MAG: tungsten formylmethanofuran dehydrogenase [Ignavibacteria bacterium]|nr:tungsten formylmethanofuran dehydrogenase [Ignavibacteria bacterium]